jgi:hypothetical protein
MMDTTPQELEQQQDYEQEEFELEEKRIVVVRYTSPRARLCSCQTRSTNSRRLVAYWIFFFSYRVPPRPQLLFSLKVRGILWEMRYVMPS